MKSKHRDRGKNKIKFHSLKNEKNETVPKTQKGTIFLAFCKNTWFLLDSLIFGPLEIREFKARVLIYL